MVAECDHDGHDKSARLSGGGGVWGSRIAARYRPTALENVCWVLPGGVHGFAPMMRMQVGTGDRRADHGSILAGKGASCQSQQIVVAWRRRDGATTGIGRIVAVDGSQNLAGLVVDWLRASASIPARFRCSPEVVAILAVGSLTGGAPSMLCYEHDGTTYSEHYNITLATEATEITEIDWAVFPSLCALCALWQAK